MNVIFTLNSRKNPPGGIFDVCQERMSVYAKRVGADFVIFRDFVCEEDHSGLLKAKCQGIVDLLGKYDRVLYLDGDVFIKDMDHNIFSDYPGEDLVMLNESDTYCPGDYDAAYAKIIKDLQLRWGKVNDHYSNYNGGVILISRRDRDLYRIGPDYFILPEYPLIVDQPYVNYKIFRDNISLIELNKKYNSMTYFEDNGWFLHFANVSDRDAKIKKYINSSEDNVAEVVNNARKEFEKYLKKYTIANNRFLNGVDVGCGTSRIDDMIISVDQQPDYKYAHAQLVWNCHDLDIFADGVMDFIFSSHCLEDFEDIPTVFLNWWRKLKIGGTMLLLLPDMEAGRYERVLLPNGKKNPNGNPSHRTDVGKNYIVSMLSDLSNRGLIKFEILQMDTIPHNASPSIDFAIKKL